MQTVSTEDSDDGVLVKEGEPQIGQKGAVTVGVSRWQSESLELGVGTEYVVVLERGGSVKS